MARSATAAPAARHGAPAGAPDGAIDGGATAADGAAGGRGAAAAAGGPPAGSRRQRGRRPGARRVTMAAPRRGWRLRLPVAAAVAVAVAVACVGPAAGTAVRPRDEEDTQRVRYVGTSRDLGQALLDPNVTSVRLTGARWPTAGRAERARGRAACLGPGPQRWQGLFGESRNCVVGGVAGKVRLSAKDWVPGGTVMLRRTVEISSGGGWVIGAAGGACTFLPPTVLDLRHACT